MVSPSVFTRVFSLAVPEKSIRIWETYLSARGLSSRPRKRIGARVDLVPVKRVRFTKVDGEPVIPRSEVITLIRDRPSVYAGAEELLVD